MEVTVPRVPSVSQGMKGRPVGEVLSTKDRAGGRSPNFTAFRELFGNQLLEISKAAAL